MKNRFCAILFLCGVIVISVSLHPKAINAQPTNTIYIGNGVGGIHKADLTTGNTEPFVLAGFLDIVGDMVLDSVSQNLYWTSAILLGGTGLYRADSAGHVTQLEVDVLGGLALDAAKRELYWLRENDLWVTNLNDDTSQLVYEELGANFRLGDMETDPERRILYFMRSQNLWRLFLDEMRVESLGLIINNRPIIDIELDLGAEKIYWVGGDIPYKLYRSNLDLTDPEEVYSFSFTGEPIYHPTISLDDSNNILFFSNIGGEEIGRFDIDSEEVDLYDVPQVRQAHFAHNGTEVFWTEPFIEGPAEGLIYRASYDGSQVDTFVVSDGDAARDLYVSPEGDVAFWIEDVVIDLETEHREVTIRKAKFTDGVTEITMRKKVDGAANALAIDFENEHMYWSDTSWVHRADLDGMNAESLIEVENLRGQLELDVQGGKMYWFESSTQHVQRANLDGSETEDLFHLPGGYPFVIDSRTNNIRWIDSSGTLYSEDLDTSLRDSSTSVVRENSILLGIDMSENMLYYRQGVDFNSVNNDSLFRRIRIDGTGDEGVPLEGRFFPLSLSIPQNPIGTAIVEEVEPYVKSPLIDSYPNPFTETLHLDLRVDMGQHLQVDIVDVLGRSVATLINGWVPQGIYPVRWAPRASLASGAYFIRVRGETGSYDVKKVMKCCSR